MTSEEKREFWSHVFELHQESKLSLRAFCDREGLKDHQYHYWRRRLLSTSTSEKGRHDAFVTMAFSSPRPAVQTRSDGCGMAIVCGNVRLELAKGFDDVEFLRAIRLLGDGSC